MGRLFWKFFVVFVLAQAMTVVAVSSAIWLRDREAGARPEFARAPTTAGLLDAATAALTRGDEFALRVLLEDWSHLPGPAVFAVGPDGREILGRPVPVLAADAASAPDSLVRRVPLADGRMFVLIVDDRRGGGPFPPPGPRAPRGPGGPGAPGRVFPIEPIAGGILASLVFAALLAWYVAKPIRNLRKAFAAAARGELDARVGDSMGRRRDELADLGRAFDGTAARLKLLVDGQRRLLHDVSHELRSPLARLQAAVGLARQQPETAIASMDRIEREAERMDKLVDELLVLSRVEAGMGMGAAEPVDLVELVQDVVQDAAFEVDAGAVPVAFVTSVEALRGAAVKGDAQMLHRALDNVVRNAGRHAPPGTRVAVDGRLDATTRTVEIVIADEGPGVDASELESIFAPFHRGAAARGTRGHGLGLAIARRVIEAHGGTIVAANRPTGGLAVAIRLPA